MAGHRSTKDATCADRSLYRQAHPSTAATPGQSAEAAQNHGREEINGHLRAAIARALRMNSVQRNLPLRVALAHWRLQLPELLEKHHVEPHPNRKAGHTRHLVEDRRIGCRRGSHPKECGRAEPVRRTCNADEAQSCFLVLRRSRKAPMTVSRLAAA
jgi:hypothetical protein